MIYIILGNDADTRLKKQAAIIAAFRKKHPDATLFSFEADSWDQASFEQRLFSRSFFDEAHILFARGVLSAKDIRDRVFELSGDLAGAPHCIIFSEESIDAATKKQIGKWKGAETILCEMARPLKDFSPFEFAELVVNLEKKKAWVAYHDAMRQGVSAEELFWPLAWKIKDALSKGRIPRSQTKEKLAAMSLQMVKMFHDAHRGGLPLELALERFIVAA